MSNHIDLALYVPIRNKDKRIHIGRYTYGRPEFRLWLKTDTINIGQFCALARGVVIFGGGEHNISFVSSYPFSKKLTNTVIRDRCLSSKGPTVIKDDVWIGEGATILSGVTIGFGAVIGAKAVIASDILPYAVVVGNPAKTIKYRFSEIEISALLRIKWWDWPIEKIVENIDYLSSPNLARFITRFR